MKLRHGEYITGKFNGLPASGFLIGYIVFLDGTKKVAVQPRKDGPQYLLIDWDPPKETDG